ncbi:hypothetical protein PSSHI_31230 [Photobacterium sp. R1]
MIALEWKLSAGLAKSLVTAFNFTFWRNGETMCRFENAFDSTKVEIIQEFKR